MPIQLRFLRRLALHYFGWWVAIAVVPAVFLDHHRPSLLQLVTAGGLSGPMCQLNGKGW